MGDWSIAIAAVSSWCALSVPVAVVVGHALAGKPIRSMFAAPDDDGVEATVIPITAHAERNLNSAV